MKLQGKTAIITGGASNIGRAIGLSLAKEGANIVIVDIDNSKGKEVLKEIKELSKAFFIEKDISKRENIADIIAEVKLLFGSIDILVNNSQSSKPISFCETSIEDLNSALNAGFYAAFNFMQLTHEELKKNKGKVINVICDAGFNWEKGQTTCAVSKEAIRTISLITANEWRDDGIDVNIISPIVHTDGVEQWRDSTREMYRAVNYPTTEVGGLCSS